MSDFDTQVKKLRRNNLLFMGAIGTLIIFLFVACIVYAVALTQENKRNIEAIRTELSALQQKGIDETLKNRKRGDAIMCIITEPTDVRDRDYIQRCVDRHDIDLNEFRITQ